MKYNPLPQEFYRKNRKKLIATLEPESCAILVSYDEMPRSGDQTHPFRQNPDLLYLCGIDQAETTLIIAPHHPNPKYREALFIKRSNEHIAVWYGHKLTQAQASEISGIKTILFDDEFEAVKREVILNSKNIYLNISENKFTSPVISKEAALVQNIKIEFPLHNYKRLAPTLKSLRVVKENCELVQLKKACEITASAFLQAVKQVKPQAYEYEIEAEIIHSIIKQGATGHSFAPIVASGSDSCILHYIENDKKMQDGDLLLLDFGAEYGNYAGDLTRTVPVNGAFSPRQKQVYEACLRVYQAAIPLFKPGMSIHKINDAVFKQMENELIGLGLFTEDEVLKQDPEKPLFKKYYMHNTSHFIGMDVHDVGERDWNFVPGMVLSCEPGIYIHEEGIGIRIETDVIVAEQPVDLFAGLPVTVSEIESLMKSV